MYRKCNAIVTHNALHNKFYDARVGIALQFSALLMPKTETLNLRVSADFKKRLIQEAAKEKRSVTNYLETVFSEIWEQRQLSEEKPKPKK
jgi:hypothetical protein